MPDTHHPTGDAWQPPQGLRSLDDVNVPYRPPPLIGDEQAEVQEFWRVENDRLRADLAAAKRTCGIYLAEREAAEARASALGDTVARVEALHTDWHWCETPDGRSAMIRDLRAALSGDQEAGT